MNWFPNQVDSDYADVVGEGQGLDGLHQGWLNALKTDFKAFQQDPLEQFRVAVRRERSNQIRNFFKTCSSIEHHTFNYEVMAFESKTSIYGWDWNGTIFSNKLRKVPRAYWGQALPRGMLDLHGNYIWLGNAVSRKQSNAFVGTVITILNDPQLLPVRKSELITGLGFSVLVASGLAMISHPRDILIYRTAARRLFGQFRDFVNSPAGYQEFAHKLSQMLAVKDFIEFDRFIEYQASRGKISNKPIRSPLVLKAAAPNLSRPSMRPGESKDVIELRCVPERLNIVHTKLANSSQRRSTTGTADQADDILLNYWELLEVEKKRITSTLDINKLVVGNEERERLLKLERISGSVKKRYELRQRSAVPEGAGSELAFELQNRWNVLASYLIYLRRVWQYISFRSAVGVARLQHIAFGITYRSYFEWVDEKLLRRVEPTDTFFEDLARRQSTDPNVPISSESEAIDLLHRAAGEYNDTLAKRVVYVAFEHGWDEALDQYVIAYPDTAAALAKLVAIRDALDSQIALLPQRLQELFAPPPRPGSSS